MLTFSGSLRVFLALELCDMRKSFDGLHSEVVDNRFVCHLPYYRQAEMFARMGVNLHRKTLCYWTMLASDWLAVIYREIQCKHSRRRLP